MSRRYNNDLAFILSLRFLRDLAFAACSYFLPQRRRARKVFNVQILAATYCLLHTSYFLPLSLKSLKSLKPQLPAPSSQLPAPSSHNHPLCVKHPFTGVSCKFCEGFYPQHQYFTINFCVLDESINFGAFNFPLY